MVLCPSNIKQSSRKNLLSSTLSSVNVFHLAERKNSSILSTKNWKLANAAGQGKKSWAASQEQGRRQHIPFSLASTFWLSPQNSTVWSQSVPKVGFAGGRTCPVPSVLASRHPAAHYQAVLSQQLTPRWLLKESCKKQRKHLAFHTWKDTL